MMKVLECNVCGNVADGQVIREIEKPDRFEIAAGVAYEGYLRLWVLCGACGCAVNVMQESSREAVLTLEDSYYEVDLGGLTGLGHKFNQVMALPDADSDNAQRVGRVLEFIANRQPVDPGNLHLCDVGSGLGVFLAKTLQVQASKGSLRIDAVGVEPDATAHEFSHSLNLFESRHGYFPDAIGDEVFDFITLNKVLEHVEKPRSLLESCVEHLGPNGYIYVEVPCVSNATIKPGDDNALGCLHRNLYSTESLRRIMESVGIIVVDWDRLEEPSGKLTVFAFGKRG